MMATRVARTATISKRTVVSVEDARVVIGSSFSRTKSSIISFDNAINLNYGLSYHHVCIHHPLPFGLIFLLQ